MITSLVTGSGGFVGAAVAERLVRRGDRVICVAHLSRPPSHRPDLFGATWAYGDVADAEFIRDVIARYQPDDVYHYAASSIVKSAKDDPAGAVRTNVYGTACVLDACRTTHRPRAILIASCYDEQTRAVTPTGFKRYDELTAGDSVFSLDAAGNIVESAVGEVVVQDYAGPMVRFHGKRLDFLVTPNHRMLIKDKDGDLSLVEAAEPVPASGWHLPSGAWAGVSKKIEVPPPAHWNAKAMSPDAPDDDILYLLGIYIGDGAMQRQIKARPSRTGKRAAEYIGGPRNVDGTFPVADTGVQAVSLSRSNSIFLYIPEMKRCRAAVESALTRVGLKFTRWDRKGVTEKGDGALYFSSSQLADIFQEAGTHARDKHVPKWVLGLPPDKQAIVFRGIMETDGSRGRMITTSSAALVRDLVEIGTKIGRSVSFTHRPPPKKAPKIRGREIKSGDSYNVYFSNPSKAIAPSMRSEVPYAGKVWCLRVPPHGNFMVERNGRVAFCGNSDKSYGEPPDAVGEDDPLRPTHVYDATKAAEDFIALAYATDHGLPVVITRSANIYGPGDLNWSRVIPGSCRRIFDGERPVLYTDAARMIREFVFVDDYARAALLLTDHMGRGNIVPGTPYNIGTGDVMAVGDLVDAICVASGRDVKPDVRDRVGFAELVSQSVKADRIRSIGWRPEVPLREGLVRAWRWYESYLANRGAR